MTNKIAAFAGPAKIETHKLIIGTATSATATMTATKFTPQRP
ncbi:hypothetical protein Z945_2487 [Sulfitobacter noctilucae]|nr:hypothetical protein Z945_2487 [Sulfitobacter noctilucae]